MTTLCLWNKLIHRYQNTALWWMWGFQTVRVSRMDQQWHGEPYKPLIWLYNTDIDLPSHDCWESVLGSVLLRVVLSTFSNSWISLWLFVLIILLLNYCKLTTMQIRTKRSLSQGIILNWRIFLLEENCRGTGTVSWQYRFTGTKSTKRHYPKKALHLFRLETF